MVENLLTYQEEWKQNWRASMFFVGFLLTQCWWSPQGRSTESLPRVIRRLFAVINWWELTWNTETSFKESTTSVRTDDSSLPIYPVKVAEMGATSHQIPSGANLELAHDSSKTDSVVVQNGQLPLGLHSTHTAGSDGGVLSVQRGWIVNVAVGKIHNWEWKSRTR